jgi:glycosyltransferase involved in cell wall biosynthesis
MALSALEMVDDMNQQGITKPDVIFCTSLTDLAALRASLPNGWRELPIVLYMHENQVAYPTNDARDASFAFTNLQSVLTADLTIFNSKWNMDSFISGIETLLENSWDTTLKDIGNRIRENSTVAWVPVELPPVEFTDSRVLHNSDNEGRAIGSEPIRIVWPHRWEHDKAPEKLLELAREYSEPLNLHWIILGEQFNQVPEALKQFKTEFAAKIDHMGYVESKGEYWKWLRKADWVLSTAEHEFFGIAVVEALFAGCLPWLPDKLSYRELLPACARGLTPATHAKNSSSSEIMGHIQDHLTMARAKPATKRIDSLISTQL